MSLTTREWVLKNWLEHHFISGRYWSIEEICDLVKDRDGNNAYKLNTDPYKHDKCIELSNDVREINWSVEEGYKIIVKDSKGGIKLCESREEFDTWRNNELAKIEPKWKFLNNLKWKAERDGTVPIYNQAMNENKDNNVVKVYAKEKRIVGGKYDGMTLQELLIAGMKESLNNDN